MPSVSMNVKKGKSSQSYHDLRKGFIPDHINKDRIKDNKTLIDHKMSKADIIKEIKSNQKQAYSTKNMTLTLDGVISFSKDFDDKNANKDTLDKCALDFINKFEDDLKVKVIRLVRHEDESKTHYHFTSINQNTENGRTAQRTLTRRSLSDFQSALGESFKPAGLTRGTGTIERLKMNLKARGLEINDKNLFSRENKITANTIHRSVSQLHNDLPLEIAVLEKKIEHQTASLNKTKNHLSKQQEKANKIISFNVEKAKKSLKLVETYQVRASKKEKVLIDIDNELKTKKAELSRLSDLLKVSDISHEVTIKTGVLSSKREMVIQGDTARAFEIDIEKREREIQRKKLNAESLESRVNKQKDSIIDGARKEAALILDDARAERKARDSNKNKASRAVKPD